MNIEQLKLQYKSELLNNVVPFWLSHSLDKEYGGYFTCLDAEGKVFDTDKFIWLQARQVWMFATLYNKVEEKKEWLDCAEHGANFLLNHGHNGDFDWYFSVDRQGAPLVDPYNIFSYTFAAMAFSALSLAANNERYGEIAKATFEKVLARKDNPKDRWDKSAGGRSLKNFALPMILCNLSLEMEHLVDPDFLKATIDTCIDEVMEVFYRPELGLVLENVTQDNQLSDTFDGRLLNPGHAIEAMWFIMDLGKRLDRPELIEKAKNIALEMVEYGWDEKYGGIFYFMDRKGAPLQQLEWDQKLWWVHLETLICMLKGYDFTGDERCKSWFEKVHEYSWKHFAGDAGGEWWGYLNRQGEVLHQLKGGKWKGCFHVPRALFQCWQVLEQLEKK
ncbi:AGE family epimerase/isomerase [Persicobacter diffluens]|uniref:N-acylglucosamine 2-epimerase n=1 Tax=Persicobacter diffluens TaxID=981 RepID=A0AAN5AM25_9BACT|nr:N-acylglucosamine 2-epimerase [Persicobacter diffluens]